MLLSFPEKHGLPQVNGVTQRRPEVGGRGRRGRQVGGRPGLCSQILFFQKQAIYQSTGVSFTVKTQGLITFEEQWTTRAKKTGPVQLMGKEGGVSSIQYFGHQIGMV